MSLLLSFWKWGMGWQRLPELEKQLYELSTGDLVAIENTLNEFSSRAATPGEKSILHRCTIFPFR